MSTKGKASGVVELIKLYDASSNMVMQGGVRRGASMGILNVNHPEIMEFIRCKLDCGIKHQLQLICRYNWWIHEGTKVRYFLGPKVWGQGLQNSLRTWDWDAIAESAHAFGDPGLIFPDKIQADNPVLNDILNKTNPAVSNRCLMENLVHCFSINLAR